MFRLLSWLETHKSTTLHILVFLLGKRSLTWTIPSFTLTLFGGKLNNPRTVLGQKLIRVGINQLKNHIQDMNKPHHSPLEK